MTDSIVVDRDIRISTVGRDDYPELEGKIIDYWLSDDICIKSIVVGCNRSLGITIVAVEDKDYYQVCFTGPVVPEPTDFSHRACTYEELFDFVIDGIQKGKIIAEEMTKIHMRSPTGGSCTGAGCAYR